jgi:hypothetical protein
MVCCIFIVTNVTIYFKEVPFTKLAQKISVTVEEINRLEVAIMNARLFVLTNCEFTP